MRKFTINKGNGKFRLIYAPDARERSELRSVLGQIERKCRMSDKDGVVHGFTRRRSCVTNALAHVGREYTLKMDLQDFFDSVGERQLKGRLSKDELSKVLVDGAARQGLPTSPAVANLAARPMDKAIIKLRTKGWDFVYTRYADDLTLSFDDPDMADRLKAKVLEIARRNGFQVNASKTKLMRARDGRRHITGLAVDGDGVYPTRKTKRRLRAALHQRNKEQARGLAEWCRCALPKPPKFRDSTDDELARLCKAWRLPKIKSSHLHSKEEEEYDDGLFVTGDPVYILGMSTWTTGWTSCMGQPDSTRPSGGMYRKGTLFWAYLQGTRIACIRSDKVKNAGGVERRTMRARALLHDLRDGTQVYDKIYGNPGDTQKLEKLLRNRGIRPTRERQGEGTKVLGHVYGTRKPYLDTLKSGVGTPKNPKRQGKVRYVHL